MTRADDISAAAADRVASWVSVPPADRATVLAAAQIRPLRSGGAMLTLGGVDRWCRSYRDALAELDAQTTA